MGSRNSLKWSPEHLYSSLLVGNSGDAAPKIFIKETLIAWGAQKGNYIAGLPGYRGDPRRWGGGLYGVEIAV